MWTTVDSSPSYDHDQLLSICHVHLASLGKGLFMELCEGKQQILQSLVEIMQTRTETTPANGTTCDTEPMQDQGSAETIDNQTVTTPADGTTCGIEQDAEARDNPAMTTLTPGPTTSQSLPCAQDEHINVCEPLLHQDSDTEGYSDYDINVGMGDTVNIEFHVTSPVQFMDEPPRTAETVTVTIDTAKSDQDTIAEFLSSSADTIPIYVSPKRENAANDDGMTHVLLNGTTLKSATIKLCKLMEIDIDLWTLPKPSEPEKVH